MARKASRQPVTGPAAGPRALKGAEIPAPDEAIGVRMDLVANRVATALKMAVRSHAQSKGVPVPLDNIEQCKSFVGIPLPSLGMEVLYRSTHIPPGVHTISGEEQSGKTLIDKYLQLLFACNDGMNESIETEHNSTPHMTRQIFRGNDDLRSRVDEHPFAGTVIGMFQKVHSLLNWDELLSLGKIRPLEGQEAGKKKEGQDEAAGSEEGSYAHVGGKAHAKALLKEILKAQKLTVPGDFTYPYHISLDSINGVQAGTAINKFMTKMEMPKEYGRDSSNENKFMLGTLTSVMQDRPAWLTMVVHGGLKFDQERMSWEPDIKGGNAVRYYSNSIIVVKRSHQIASKSGHGLAGYRVLLTNYKSKMGPTGAELPLDIVWTGRDEDARIDLLWPAAFVRYVFYLGIWSRMKNASADDKRNYRGQYEELQELTGLRWVGFKPDFAASTLRSLKELVWSDALGVPEEDPISFQEMGLKIDRNPEMRAKIRSILRINVLKDYVSANTAEKLIGKRLGWYALRKFYIDGGEIPGYDPYRTLTGVESIEVDDQIISANSSTAPAPRKPTPEASNEYEDDDDE